MKLFHGINRKFENIDLEKSKDKRDFGKGFYTTDQAIARILAGLLKKPFDEVLGMFYSSRTFAALKNTESCMWAESSQFIADEYLREKNINLSQNINSKRNFNSMSSHK